MVSVKVGAAGELQAVLPGKAANLPGHGGRIDRMAVDFHPMEIPGVLGCRPVAEGMGLKEGQSRFFHTVCVQLPLLQKIELRGGGKRLGGDSVNQVMDIFTVAVLTSMPKNTRMPYLSPSCFVLKNSSLYLRHHAE